MTKNRFVKYLTFMLLLAVLPSCDNKDVNKSQPPLPPVMEKGGVRVYPVTLDGKEKTSHAIHADIPLIGGRGDDTYKFNGKILFADKTVKMSIESYKPLCVVKIDDKYYLLAYYYFTNKLYEVYLFDNNSFVVQEFTNLPDELSNVTLDDMYYSKSFKIWFLDNALQSKGVDKALDLLEKVVSKNSRAFWLGDAKAYDKLCKEAEVEDSAHIIRKLSTIPKMNEVRHVTSKTTYVYDLLEKIYKNTNKNVLWENRLFDLTVRIFFACSSEDRPQQVFHTFLLIREFDQDKADNYLHSHINDDFIKKVSDKSVQDYYREKKKRYKLGD